MKTPEKCRDRIFRAIVRYIERHKLTTRQRQDAYEDLMVVIDTVIEELDGEAIFRRGFANGELSMSVAIERGLLKVFKDIPSEANADAAWAAARKARR